LMAAAPDVKILVTSRIALNLQSEHIYPVPPLNLPQPGERTSVTEISSIDSVKLFVERARAVNRGFELTEENAPAVVEICRMLDGLPLALELAAARIKIFKPQAILSRLDDALKFLKGGSRDLAVRHQTLHNTLEWSYSLLGPDEQTLFARLGVFVGGFTLEAAEAVCNPDDGLDILEGVTSLVNNSLLYPVTTSDDEPRFGMLETVRAYAVEQLSTLGEMDPLRERHARYYGGITINHIGLEIYSEKALYWLDWLERDLSNLRATLSWCLSSPAGIELGVGIVTDLVWFWYRRGYFLEGLTWTERILASPDIEERTTPRAIAQQTYGILSIWKGEQEKGLTHLDESLQVLLRTEDNRWIAPGFLSKAVALINMGRDQEAQPLLFEAKALFEAMNFDYFLAITLVHLGNVELGLEHPERARQVLEEAQRLARTLNEPWILSFALNNLGEVARVLGDYDRARGYYQECQQLLGSTGDRGDMARFVHSLAYLAQHEADLDGAEAQFRESLLMFRRLGNRRGMAECLAGLAGVQARQRQLTWGATMLGAAESVLHSTGGAWWPADRVEVERTRELLKSELKADAYRQAWQAGDAMNLDQAIAFAADAAYDVV
jgi:predicted ATPase